MADTPRQYALIKVTPLHKQWLLKNGQKNSPLLSDDVFVFLGEIPNMPKHCVIAGYTSGKIFSGYPLFNFVELTEDEV
jgi:hypothetical protein